MVASELHNSTLVPMAVAISLLSWRPQPFKSTVATCGLGVLPTHTNAPVMAQTSVQSDALHPLHVLANRLVEEICVLLGGLPIFDIALTIEHPGWDLELERIADHSNDFVHLVCCQFSSTLVH